MAIVRASVRGIKKRADGLIRKNNLVGAHELYASVCKNDPSDATSWLKFATLNRKLGSHKQAGQCARHVLSMQPDNCSALMEYGASLQHQGELSDAIKTYEKVLEINPGHSEAHYFLATAFLGTEDKDAAIKHYRKTIELVPTHIGALNNLSALLTDQGDIQGALGLLERALRLRPNAYHMMINQARSRIYMGDTGKALELLDQVIRTHPDSAEAHSKYLLCLNYLSSSRSEIFEQHVRWADRHAGTFKRYTTYENIPGPGRKLRIAYLSPDLKRHSVAYFLEPILANHDRDMFSITCYADIMIPDVVSQRLESLCDDWLLTKNLSDEQLAERIRADRIDILIDLAGHTANNRLPVFARKPAPLQATYLGYPNTSGLQEMDYRLTDAIADPPGDSDRYCTETLVRLAGGFLCYQPPADAPDVDLIPGKVNGRVVFGSFNNLAKVTPELIRVWSEILKAVDASILLFKCKATSDPYTRTNLLERFAEQGVGQSRLQFLDYAQSNTEHLKAYNRVDIALDTFPYNGTTTTCEALWMGTPVIILAGASHASRVSYSILSRIGLESLVACDVVEYVELAVKLAADSDRRTELHYNLRRIMQSSSLCDAASFCKNLEIAYRDMWKKCCEKTASPPGCTS